MPTAVKRQRRPLNQKPLTRLPLAGLRVFVIAAEELNFSRAGAVLGMSTAAVSMQVRALEDYLRVPLFKRHGRRISLSEQGEALLPQVRAALEDLESAITALRVERHTGHVTVSMLPSFLQLWLLPRLADFQSRHPSIDLRLETSRSLVQFSRSDVQAAIRLGKGGGDKLHADKLFDEWLVPVCAPAFRERHGWIERSADLKRVPLLHSTSEPWESWVDGRANTLWARSGSTLDDSASVARAAMAGQGLALARWSLVAGDVLAGGLVFASKRLTQYEYSYHFVCPKFHLQLEKLVAFRDWLVAQGKSFPTPQAVLKQERSSGTARG